MKRKLMSMVCLLLVSIVAFAGNPFKSITGKENLKAIMASEGKALLVVDWSEAKYDKDKDLKEKLDEDYDFVLGDCEKSFAAGFNKQSKRLQLAQGISDAKYKFVLKVASIDRYMQVMTFIPKHEAKMWGNLEILDAQTGNTLVTVNIDEAEDGYDSVPKECFGKTFFKLGERTAKLK